MSAYAKRTDSNHAEIRDKLREVGFWVWDTHDLGSGFPDLIALNKSGDFVMLEVKARGGKLTDDELTFFRELIEVHHCRNLLVVHSIEDAMEALA